MVKNSATSNGLEDILWGAANILRGYLDAGDYKQFIFPLLFLKRISDVYEEEYNHALKESDGDIEYASFAENHRFQIPDGAHWNDLRNCSKNIGLNIKNSMRAIENANQEMLYGIFGDAQWTNKQRLSDHILKDLIEYFSRVDMTLENVPEDQFGIAYEYLIKKFADDSGHTAAEFYTNRTLVSLMTLITNPQKKESIYDPTCGSGGMLLVAALYLKQQGKEYRSLKLYGQEINLLTSAIAKMNLFLHGIEDFKIIRGDTLENPAFIQNDRIMKFDIILANPPYSFSNWNIELWKNDPYGRNMYGSPPKNRADYAFFQHILHSMKPQSGRCAILFPHGVLFREEEKEIRRKIIESDMIECILGLGPNLFYNSPMEACIIFCKMKKPIERKNRILFINAIEEITRDFSYSYLEKKHIEKIHKAFIQFKDIKNFARVVDIEDILRNDSNLSISLYIRPKKKKIKKELNEEFMEWNNLNLKLKNEFEEFIEKLIRSIQ